MARTRRPSPQAVMVLLALLAEPHAWRHGYSLCRETGIKPGSLYPILIRLADQELLETTWQQPTASGRPPRHLYRLTPRGLAAARMQPAARARANTGPAGQGRLRPQAEPV